MGLVLSLLLAAVPPPPLAEERVNTPGPCLTFTFGHGSALAVGLKGGVQVIRDNKAPKLLRHRGDIEQLLYDPKSRAFIARDRRDRVVTWDALTFRPLRAVVEDPTVLPSLTPDGNSFASVESGKVCFALANARRGIRLWAPRRTKPDRLEVLEVHLSRFSKTPLDRITATAAIQKALLLGNGKGELFRLSDPADLFDRRSLPGVFLPKPVGGEHLRAHRGAVTTVAVAPGTGRCLSAGADGKVRVWRLNLSGYGEKPQPEWETSGHVAAFSPDGRFLAVAAPGGLGIYHSGSGIAISWNRHPPGWGRIIRLSFAPDGASLLGIVCTCRECRAGKGATRTGSLHAGNLIRWK